MRRHLRRQHGRPRDANVICVDGVVPNPEFDHEPLPEQILGIALDQRAFGPRKLMVAFAAHDGRFLALLYAQRTVPITDALEGCMLHFESLGRGGEAKAAAVVLCDEPVEDGTPSPEFVATFELAQGIARQHGVTWSTGSPAMTIGSDAHDCAPSLPGRKTDGGTFPRRVSRAARQAPR